MYNRYVPQPDGTFSRSFVPERPVAPPSPPCAPPPPPPSDRPQTPPPPHHGSAAGFLKNLLPQAFDTGDLIVVLLLLLLAGDCEEDRGTALLTLVLYLFM